MRIRALTMAAVLAATPVALAACSVVGDGKVDNLNPPFGLDDTALPTTTAPATTTAPTTTAAGLEIGRAHV